MTAHARETWGSENSWEELKFITQANPWYRSNITKQKQPQEKKKAVTKTANFDHGGKYDLLSHHIIRFKFSSFQQQQHINTRHKKKVWHI